MSPAQIASLIAPILLDSVESPPNSEAMLSLAVKEQHFSRPLNSHPISLVASVTVAVVDV